MNGCMSNEFTCTLIWIILVVDSLKIVRWKCERATSNAYEHHLITLNFQYQNHFYFIHCLYWLLPLYLLLSLLLLLLLQLITKLNLTHGKHFNIWISLFYLQFANLPTKQYSTNVYYCASVMALSSNYYVRNTEFK